MFEPKEYIISGPSYPFAIPKKPYGQLLLENIQTGGKKIALIDAITQESITYTEIVIKSLKLAESFRGLRLSRGDIVAICSENRIEYPLCVLAALSIGLSVGPLNFAYKRDELIHAMKILTPRVIICSPIVLNDILKILPFFECVTHVIVFGSIRYLPNVINFNNLLCPTIEMDIAKFSFEHVDIKEDVALILFSSGTTGLPKGVMLTYNNLLWNFLINIVFLAGSKDRITVDFLPFFHSYGCIMLMNNLAFHMQEIFLSKFDEDLYYKTIERYRATALSVVPPICVLLAKSPLVANYDLSSVRQVRCGAAPLSDELAEVVARRLNLSAVIQGYGLTEVTLSAIKQDEDGIKIGGIGKLLTGLQAKVLDLQTGASLGPNQSGELCLKGEVIMKGYRGNPEETATTIDKDGWLHTGDIVYYNDNEFFFLVDRLKELIKYKGYQVAPAEIEALLLQHTAIKDAAVVGLIDESVGEKPVAFVVRQPNARITAQEIKDYIANKVSPQKRLHGGVHFISAIPKNPSGKILRRELRKIVNYKAHL